MNYFLSLKSDNAQGAVALCGAISKIEELRTINGTIASGHNALLTTMLHMGYSYDEAALLMTDFEFAKSLIRNSCLGLVFQNLIGSFYKVKIDAILGSIIPHGEEITFSQLEELSSGRRLFIFNPASESYYSSCHSPDMEVSQAILNSILIDGEDIELSVFRTLYNVNIDNIITITSYDETPKFSTGQILKLCKFFTKTSAKIPKFAENILYHPANIYIPIAGLRRTRDLMRAGKKAATKVVNAPAPSLESSSVEESSDGFHVSSFSSDEFIVIDQYEY